MQSPDILLQIFRSRLGTTINLQVSDFSLFGLLKELVFRLLNGFVQSYESSPTQIRIPCPIVQVMHLNKAPRLSIKRVIWILAYDL